MLPNNILTQNERLRRFKDSSARWLAMARFIFSAFSGGKPRLTVFPRTFLVHLQDLGGWGMTLPWLNDSKFPILKASAR